MAKLATAMLLLVSSMLALHLAVAALDSFGDAPNGRQPSRISPMAPRTLAAQKRCASASVSAASTDTDVDLRWDLIRRQGKGQPIPGNAVWSGYWENLEFYVGRIWHAGAIIPARVFSTDGHAVTSWADEAISVNDNIQVAVVDKERLRWVAAANGRVPEGAVKGGVSEDNETLYICRVMDPDIVTYNNIRGIMSGVLRPNTGVCAFEFYGHQSSPTYEVLVADISDRKCCC